jgi:hypothetical protein
MRMKYAALASSALLAWCSAWGAPVLTLEPLIIDWGRQTENKGEYTFTFTLKNTGDEELKIDKVKPGCSCTKAELKKDTLAPGESTELTGTLATKNVQGALRKAINFTSNDPVHPTVVGSLAIRFPFNGTGVRLRIDPTPVFVQEKALWAYVTLENCEPETPAQIDAIEVPAGWETPQSLPVTIPVEERFSFAIKRQAEVGPEEKAFDGVAFTVVTNSTKTPRIQGTVAYRPAPPPAPAPAPATPATPPAAAPAAGATPAP